MRVYISGVHSGPNPSPGVGTAKSIRLAYPNASLVAVDYSNRSSGIHHEVFDDVWLQLPWDQLNLDLYKEQIQEVLNLEETFWISGLDLEVHWLSQNLTSSHKILVTPYEKLLLTLKPSITAHKKLSLRVPPYLTITESDWKLHAFCRQFGWKVWLKGPYYEARRVRFWDEFESARVTLSQMWSTQNLFLQAHINGYEESIAFCAYQGKLLDCVYMTKRDLTVEGKTWAGRVNEVSSDVTSLLEDVISELNWMGGAEIEFVRDSNGTRWLIDWNGRFPAWIYGATIAGHNLPAKLVSEAGNYELKEMPLISQEFTRVVSEIPVRKEFPLQTLSETSNNVLGWSSKHPSGMPLLAKRFSEKRPMLINNPPPIPNILGDLANLDLIETSTPFYFICEGAASKYFSTIQEISQQISSSSGVSLRIAYSIKTNPSTSFIRTALENGMLAEAISQLEIKHAHQVGFPLDQIILNGPAKFWPAKDKIPIETLKAIFCDSINELQLVSQHTKKPRITGIRLQPITINSRFGIPLDRPENYKDLLAAIENLTDTCLGVHFHFASSLLGPKNWHELFDSVIEWAYYLQEDSKHNIVCLDVGGGWFPDDWKEIFLPQLKQTLYKSKKKLSYLTEFIIEPGKALVQPFAVLIVSVCPKITFLFLVRR